MPPLSIVLLGGTGFVGSAVMRQLAARHEANASAGPAVHLLVRRTDPSARPPWARNFSGSLDALHPSLFPDGPHVVIHLATKQIDEDRMGFDKTNVEGTARLLRALRPSCQGVFYGSSLSVYGQGPQEGHDESAVLAPETALARSRASAEALVLQWGKSCNKAAAVFRPRFVLGEGDRFTLPGLLKLFRRGLLLGSGNQAFTVVDVDDYADIIVRRALETHPAHHPACGALHVGYERPVSLNDLRHALSGSFRLPRTRARVPISMAALRLFARLPLAPVASVVTKLQLFGLPHYVNVQRLNDLAPDIVSKDPQAMVTRAVRLLESAVNE